MKCWTVVKQISKVTLVLAGSFLMVDNDVISAPTRQLKHYNTSYDINGHEIIDNQNDSVKMVVRVFGMDNNSRYAIATSVLDKDIEIALPAAVFGSINKIKDKVYELDLSKDNYDAQQLNTFVGIAYGNDGIIVRGQHVANYSY